MARIAIENENLETGDNAKEISLGTTCEIDGKEAYAITKYSVVFWDGTSKKFMALSPKDVMELQRIISKQFVELSAEDVMELQSTTKQFDIEL